MKSNANLQLTKCDAKLGGLFNLVIWLKTEEPVLLEIFGI